MTFLAEQRRRLVEDAGGHTDGSPLGSLAGEHKLQRLDLELRGAAERQRDNHLQGAGGAEACALGQVAAERARDADGRPAELRQLPRHRRGVPAPAAGVAAPVCGELDCISV